MWRWRPGPPEWRSERGARTRVVVENLDPLQQWLEDVRLREAGYDVILCAGPRALRRQACPVVAGEDCPAIAEADVVVSSLRVENPTERAVIAGIQARYAGIPLIVEAPPAAVEAYADVLDGCHVVFPLTAETLLEAVEHALARPGPARA